MNSAISEKYSYISAPKVYITESSAVIKAEDFNRYPNIVFRDIELRTDQALLFPIRKTPTVIISKNFYSSTNENSEEFEKLKTNWINEIGYHSNPNILYNNLNYKKIIGMGAKVIPYLIEDLRREEGDWFFALYQITKINPVKEQHNGDYEAMANDWIEWSEKFIGI